MCGISCLLSAENCAEKLKASIDNLRRRGPDYHNELFVDINDSWKGSFFSSILHTQGEELTYQPIHTSRSIFLWNGDVFDGPLKQNDFHISDTSFVLNWLDANDGNILQLVKLIQGPYCFIYFDLEKQLLWISRDVLGRHSLLWDVTDSSIFICSVSHKSIQNLSEVPAAGVFCFQFDNSSIKSVTLYPWSHWTVTTWDLPVSVQICDSTINYFDFVPKWIDYCEKFDFFVADEGANHSEIMYNLLQNVSILDYVDNLSNKLTQSVKKRVTIQRNACQNCSPYNCSEEHTKIGILFSGGLDSTLVAYLASQFIPEQQPVDLLNVAFEKNSSFDVPDRKTGLASLQELRTLCPTRKWNFVEINVSRDELKEKRETHISHLIYPLKTILDESLGCALWFACRGEGSIENIAYKSPSKIILLGTGADEQLGGYTRHRNLLKRSGWQDLGKQLIKETVEISKRNLARDDRIASDHGRQPRFPFLDESVVSFISELAPWQRCDPISFPAGIGDKLILRLVAYKLGLKQCAGFPKRAFQFGCRIANSKEKGDECSERLVRIPEMKRIGKW